MADPLADATLVPPDDAATTADRVLLAALMQALQDTASGWARRAHYQNCYNALWAATWVLTTIPPPPVLTPATLTEHQDRVAAAQAATADSWNPHYPYATARGPAFYRLLAACHSAVTAALAHLAGDAAGCAVALARVAAWRESVEGR